MAEYEERTEGVIRNGEDDEDDEDDADEIYEENDDSDGGDAEMDVDLAGTFDDAEVWFAQELVSTLDEFSLTNLPSLPSRGSEPLFPSLRAGDRDDFEGGPWPPSPSRSSRAGNRVFAEAGRLGWRLGGSPSPTRYGSS